MAYTVRIMESVQKAIRKLPKEIQERVFAAISLLRETPRPPNVRKLQGMENSWRIRVSDYRIIYSIEDKELLILILKVANRKEAYR